MIHRNAKCVSATSFELCGIRGPDPTKYYFGPETPCGPGTVCKPIVVSGVQSVICGFK